MGSGDPTENPTTRRRGPSDLAFSTAAGREVDVGLELAREQQSGLDGIVVGVELATERPVTLLQPQ